MSGSSLSMSFSCFFFNDTATTEIYTLSLHDALPICAQGRHQARIQNLGLLLTDDDNRSEEHTSELQSRRDLVCRLLLEKKNINNFPSDRLTHPARVLVVLVSIGVV